MVIPNRYKQLLASIPGGSFYASDGQVLPFRGTKLPYQLKVSTGIANRQYAIYINEQFITFVTTNSSGLALINATLAKGRNDIKLVDTITSDFTLACVTTRDYATLLAAESQVIEGIDAGIEQVLLDSRLETSSISLIESIFGKTVETANDFGYDLDTYRDLLSELRTAYRHWSGTAEGISRVVRAFTQVTPLIFPVNIGPCWILDGDTIVSKIDSTVSHVVPTQPVNLNGGTNNVRITRTRAMSGSLQYTASTHTLSWDGGPPVQITSGTSSYTVAGNDYTSILYGVKEPYDIVAGVNDVFDMEMDDRGRISIPLTAGAARTAAQIASDINAALLADPRYGVTNFASSYNGGGAFDTILALNTGAGYKFTRYMRLYPRSGADATQTLFNLPATRGVIGGVHPIGSTAITLGASTDLELWPDVISDPIECVIGGTTFSQPGLAGSLPTFSASELVMVSNIDKSTLTLTLASPTTILHNTDEIIYSKADWPVEVKSVLTRGDVDYASAIDLTIRDYTLLPLVDTTDSITVPGTASVWPDGWVTQTLGGGAPTPGGLSRTGYFDQTVDGCLIFFPAHMVSIPVPDDILEYRGFDATFDIWGKCSSTSLSSALVTIESMGISFDNQATYTYAAPTVTGTAINLIEKPQRFSVRMRIPSNATRMWVRARLTDVPPSTYNHRFYIHKVRVGISPISAHGGLYLGDGTVPRNEHKIKQGNIIFCWSPEPLSIYEDQSLGLSTIDQSEPGHIDKIAPAEAYLEKFDVTEFVGTSPINLFGCFNEVHWSAGLSTNLDLVLRTPSRASFLKPSLVSATTQNVLFAMTPAHVATLTIPSDEAMSNSILLQDGVPLTQDTWRFNSSTEIELLTTPSSLSVYELQYHALIRFESAVIDLGSTYADYMWMSDYHVWLRPELDIITSTVTTGVQFDSAGIATLLDKSNLDKSTASLVEDSGLTRRIIPAANWDFVGSGSIRISQEVFNINSLYEFTYVAEDAYPITGASATVELRSATYAGGLSSAVYRTVRPNDSVDTYRYQQMRVTLHNIRDSRDARIQSLSVKGLNLFGISGTVPVFRP